MIPAVTARRVLPSQMRQYSTVVLSMYASFVLYPLPQLAALLLLTRVALEVLLDLDLGCFI